MSAELEEVWVASYTRLVAQLTAFTGDRAEAEDVVQEAFAKAVDAWRSTWPEQPEAWLRVVAVNLARRRWRRLRRGLALHQLDVQQEVPGLSADRVAVLSALKQLPAVQREAFVLHHMVDLPVAEVAALTGASVNTVKSRLARGRTALAALIDPSVDDPIPTEARHG